MLVLSYQSCSVVGSLCLGSCNKFKRAAEQCCPPACCQLQSWDSVSQLQQMSLQETHFSLFHAESQSSQVFWLFYMQIHIGSFIMHESHTIQPWLFLNYYLTPFSSAAFCPRPSILKVYEGFFFFFFPYCSKHKSIFFTLQCSEQ